MRHRLLAQAGCLADFAFLVAGGDEADDVSGAGATWAVAWRLVGNPAVGSRGLGAVRPGRVRGGGVFLTDGPGAHGRAAADGRATGPAGASPWVGPRARPFLRRHGARRDVRKPHLRAPIQS